METRLQQLHTFFLFPFSIDREAVVEDHHRIWNTHRTWIDGLDEWIAAHRGPGKNPFATNLGGWRRAAYTRFDMDSPAYQDMVFFHPFVRRVFFDTIGGLPPDLVEDEEADVYSAGQSVSLLRCYAMPLPKSGALYLEASDVRGRSARVLVTDLRLFLFANGIGILSIGVEASNISAEEALWINESMRKVYPSSSRQVREGRIPNRVVFLRNHSGQEEILVEERYENRSMIGFLPPLSKIVTSLLYFADYQEQEFEPVLDERMIVYTYAAIDPRSIPPDFRDSREYQVLLSRLLYVDRAGDDFRYEEVFTTGQMRRQMYRRWAHQGTWYGFTSYSTITCTIGSFDCDEHQLQEGFLIHRMFRTRYYLLTLIALFYRVTLLDFAERTALVSGRLYRDQLDQKFSPYNIRLASDLRADFLHFSNYWYFEELANKDEEMEHFTMMCRETRIEQMKREIEEEIEKLNASLHNYYQYRNTESINRLAMLSMILGAGAVVTGFFGMNFGHRFEDLFFNPPSEWGGAHVGAIVFVILFALSSLLFSVYVVTSNWSDYRQSLLPRWWLNRTAEKSRSLRRVSGGSQ
jgi:hypothetical protein